MPTNVFRRDLFETNCAATPKSADVRSVERGGTKLDLSRGREQDIRGFDISVDLCRSHSNDGGTFPCRCK